MTNKWTRTKEGITQLGPRVVSAFFGLSLPTGSLSNDPNSVPAELATRIYHFLTIIAYPLALIGIISSAYVLLNSMGNPEAYTKVKRNIGYIIAGIILMIFTGVIFRLVQGFFTNLYN